MAITIDDIVMKLETLVAKKRKQAGIVDENPNKTPFSIGAASAMNVVSDEIMDIIQEIKYNH